MLITFLMATPYVGIYGQLAHIKRTLKLDPDFDRYKPETENSKFFGGGGAHIGYTHSFGKPFVGIEGYFGRLFGEDYFKPQMSFGAKAIAGINVTS